MPDIVCAAVSAMTMLTINNITVSAAVNEKTNITLVYLTNMQSEKAAFYIYDKASETFATFHPLAVSGGTYIRTTGETGTAKLTVSADGLEPVMVCFEIR